ncbi:MAG: helix-turn-helix domain-containing protein [Alphaproteobacteria bacterium]|nr:helix-turn-helix domain-containing protein [Alphaproteobacteria bacterium]
MGYLKHYGTPRHSGRYPWGSGKDPQRSKSFATRVSELKKQGLSQPEIAEHFGLKNSTELRAKLHMEKEAQYGAKVAMASRLRAKGYSDVAIAKRMEVSPNTVKNLLRPETQQRHKETAATREMIRAQADKKGMIDVGEGSELLIGVARTKMDVSIAELKEKGYYMVGIQTPQLGTTNKTTVRTLMSPETMAKARAEYVVRDPAKWRQLTQAEKDYKVAYLYASKHAHEIQLIGDWSSDGGETFNTIKPPVSIDSKRVMVRFDDDTPSGSSMDGVIQIRRGVPDLALPPDKHYGQGRIAVDGTHYMKGMVIYAHEELPPGIDVIYNTNKNSSVGKLGAMKKMNKVIDAEDGGAIYVNKDGKQKINEFGASIRQTTYIDKHGKEQQSALNIVGFVGKQDSGVEGSWSTWSKTLSSQFLSKQNPELAKQQLNLAYLDQKDTLDSYLQITQPAVKQRLLDSFADDCDSKAVHLKAAALPRQSSNVLIPITSLKDDECYSPTFRAGEKLVLIRYPHAGTFEIPVVTNNLKNKEAQSILGNGTDAIGITPRTAEKLSGADFDGDTVIAIPYNPKTIRVSKALEAFDPKKAYPKYEGMPVMTAKQKGNEMGKISNLITDMTIKGAPLDEVARAVKHSMVVIDAEKHELNYKLSYTQNRIAELKVKYQGGTLTKPRGSSTLISRASSEQRVDKRKPLTKEQALASGRDLVRKGDYSVDKATGEKVYAYTNEGYTNKKGVFVKSQISSTKMYETSDAYSLVGKTREPIEIVYADYANSMKALGNLARKESASISMTPYSPSAKQAYAEEVSSLNRKLKVAKANKPLERRVHLVGNKVVQDRITANPDMERSQIKKLKGQVLADQRVRVGANKQRVVITKREWEAIEAGAISNNLLKQILSNTDLDMIQSYAIPKSRTIMSESKIARARIYQAQGRALSEIADALGVSVSTLSRSLKGEG